MILAGDVGGTKTLLLLREDGRTIAEERYASQAYGDLSHMVKEFLDATGGRPARAAIGVAGPVNDNRCWATNLPWQIDGDKLAFQLGIGKIRLLNDFATIGYGLESLGPDDVVALNDRQPDPRGPIAILGAGTGLGEGLMVWCGERYVFVPSEGGHADFAARNDREVGFLRFMLGLHERVSIERAISGPGIGNLFRYLVDAGRKPHDGVAAAVAAGEDIASVVSAHAKARDCPVSVETMDMFLNLYGAEAGNLALKVLATGGVFLAGGIAAKNIDLIRAGPFMAAFGDKGRLSDLVRSIPVRVVVNTRVGLLGAASVAERL
jgi:glucokinase